jgi:hypothetical protein
VSEVYGNKTLTVGGLIGASSIESHTTHQNTLDVEQLNKMLRFMEYAIEADPELAKLFIAFKAKEHIT